MKYYISLVLLCSLTSYTIAQETRANAGKENRSATAGATGALENELEKKRLRLPNGWHLSPAGRSLPLGDLPLNLAVSPTKKWIAVTNNGQSIQSIQLIDAVSEMILDNVVIPK